MLLWVGLGNPEPGMQLNRHNIGFMAVDCIAQKYGFSPWRKRFRGEVAEGNLNGEKILLLKPMTYMNLSGESVQQAASFYKLPIDAITVFHDELDLLPGRIRIKQGGGAAGHNGLRSIDQRMGNPNYWRIRMGIGHPGNKALVSGYVLSNFSKNDQVWLNQFLDATAEAAPLLVQQKQDAFMTKVALLTKE